MDVGLFAIFHNSKTERARSHTQLFYLPLQIFLSTVNFLEAIAQLQHEEIVVEISE